MALCLALKRADKEIPLDIEVSPKPVLDVITKGAVGQEDQGFDAAENKTILKNALSSLRARKATTRVKLVKKDERTARHDQALKLAREAASKPISNEINENIQVKLTAPGAKLSKMTQALAYRHIKRRKLAKKAPRQRTVQMVEKIKAQIEELFGFIPTDKLIWRAVRNRDFSKKTQNFLWRNGHDAYMVGDKWLRKNFQNEVQERAYCQYCNGKLESMEHIMTECEAPGQDLIWSLAEKLWKKKKSAD
ncbi:hypothetical protein MPER_04149, partial [Moniliophthora perniciosa FA553]